MKNKFEAVKTNDPHGTGWEVKTQIREHGHWYTACDTFAVNGDIDLNAKEMAEVIAGALNEYMARKQRAKDCLAGMRAIKKYLKQTKDKQKQTGSLLVKSPSGSLKPVKFVT